MVVKNNLRVMMAQHKMNIQDVSVATGLSRKSVSKLYHEISIQITFDVMERLCDLFECDPGDLLFIEKESRK
ncbi:putative transcriptional regulator [Virgibacillus natechei]|uniref:Transcriptional regulator n=1 Tax=Virgibacillus natechei TaxID=1216297 RepID=A0ABS4IKX9_9BACI|nr:helix-turn-helix transcriptional regulator [Virgibacillus natechei]MBP1971620.1 putative transcriptional regulator [Virgibacillus natechei]UZD13052.1 helix-turn-helix transcriptional regulator [Virgibacillus natechei]